MKRFYEILNKQGKRVNRENYQKAMIKRYREDVPVIPIKDNRTTFIYPSLLQPAFVDQHEFNVRMKIEKSNGGLTKISLEGDEESISLQEITATIDGRFKLKKLREK